MVLVGDAAHGMPPFCGAGASAGIIDAVELAKVIVDHLIGESLSYTDQHLRQQAAPTISTMGYGNFEGA